MGSRSLYLFDNVFFFLPALVDQEFSVLSVLNSKRNQISKGNAGFDEIGVLFVDNVELEHILIKFETSKLHLGLPKYFPLKLR